MFAFARAKKRVVQKCTQLALVLSAHGEADAPLAVVRCDDDASRCDDACGGHGGGEELERILYKYLRSAADIAWRVTATSPWANRVFSFFSLGQMISKKQTRLFVGT